MKREVHKPRNDGAQAVQPASESIECDDSEVATFVKSQPIGTTYSEIAARTSQTFGAARAWSRERVFVFLNAPVGGRRPRPTRFDNDPELSDFVEDRMNRFKLDEIVAQCRARFGAGRTPSRSAVHRHFDRVRARLQRSS